MKALLTQAHNGFKNSLDNSVSILVVSHEEYSQRRGCPWQWTCTLNKIASLQWGFLLFFIVFKVHFHSVLGNMKKRESKLVNSSPWEKHKHFGNYDALHWSS